MGSVDKTCRLANLIPNARYRSDEPDPIPPAAPVNVIYVDVVGGTNVGVVVWFGNTATPLVVDHAPTAPAVVARILYQYRVLDVGVCVVDVDVGVVRAVNVVPSVDTCTVYPDGVAPPGVLHDIVTQFDSPPDATDAFSATVTVGLVTWPSGVLLRNAVRMLPTDVAPRVVEAPVVTSYTVVPAYEFKLKVAPLPNTVLIPVNVMLPVAGTDIYFTSSFFQPAPLRLR